MDLSASESAFLEDLARIAASWEDSLRAALADPASASWVEDRAALEQVATALATPELRAHVSTLASEIIRGALHSALASLDGASALAETTILTVTDQDGREFRTHLHEYWPEFSHPALKRRGGVK